MLLGHLLSYLQLNVLLITYCCSVCCLN